MTQKEARDRMIRRMRLDGSTMEDIDFSETPAEARERMVARLHGDDQEFESKHKRDKDGRFAKMSEGASPKGAEQSPAKESERSSKGSKESGRGSGKENGGQSPDKETGASKSKASNGSKSGAEKPSQGAQQTRPKPIDTPAGTRLYEKAQRNEWTYSTLVKNPLMKKALAELRALKEQFGDTKDIDTPEREALRNDVVMKQNAMGCAVRDEKGKVHYTGKVGKGHRMDIVIGLPGGGKSSTAVDKISEKLHSRVVDSDEIKKCLPEYNDGLGAGVVHEESSDILNNRILPQYWKGGELNGDNIVTPIVGANPGKLIKYVKAAKEAGYSVHIVFNDVSVKTALNRTTARYATSGRAIDPDYTFGCGDGCVKTYELAKKMFKGIVDSFTRIDNNGAKPKTIETVGNNKWQED